MAKFFETKEAGFRTEAQVKEVLQQYSDRVYSNIRVPTLYTEIGNTEIDLLSIFGDTILVVEVKNIRRIEGELTQSFWTLEGANAGAPYTALNILTQNRIHVRAVKRAWFELRREFPMVLSIVVTPNECEIPDDIYASGVIPISEFITQIAELKEQTQKNPVYLYAFDYLVENLIRKSKGVR